MTQPQQMRDLIVLIPGILGSVLVAKDGREVWGGGKTAIRNLVTFGRALTNLKLPPGIGHNDPKDGVSASRTLPRLYILPTLGKCDGYGKLVQQLLQRFKLTPAAELPGNFIEFPYDWRLSNELNARRLADVAVPQLERWQRDKNGGPDAKLILICHSMGGLIARWFLEKLGGREITRTLITLGTPYRGSMNALDALVNGMYLGFGPLGLSVDELVRSFPSVYQLLPTYKCLDLGDGELRELSGLDLPDLTAGNIQEAQAFHKRISQEVELSPRYKTFVIKGVDQPTAQSALLRNRRVECLNSHRGTDHKGDGTVPRPSSHPPEWDDDRASVFAAQKHAMLQSTDSVLTQLSGVLTDRLGNFMGGSRIGVALPEVVQMGQPISVAATSVDGDPSLPLHVICEGETGDAFGAPKLMRAVGDGRYQATIDGLPEGAWCITVRSATPARPVEPVSDWILVWSADAFQ